MLLVTLHLYGCSIDAQGNRVIGGPGFGEAGLYSPSIGIKDRSDAIEKYLAHKTLAPIEGVWAWENNTYEAAIIRNTTEYYKGYDFVGIVTDTRNKDWSPGQIKLLLKETASPQAYSGIYLAGERNEIGTMFFLSSHNLIEFNLPDSYGITHRTVLVRNFPKSSQTQPIVETEDSSGTGFFVAQDVVATNYQVVKDAKQISILVGGGDQSTVRPPVKRCSK